MIPTTITLTLDAIYLRQNKLWLKEARSRRTKTKNKSHIKFGREKEIDIQVSQWNTNLFDINSIINYYTSFQIL